MLAGGRAERYPPGHRVGPRRVGDAPLRPCYEPSVRAEFFSDLGRIAAEDWDALVGEDDPFVEHAFLRALEESGSVGGDSGWTPMHLTLWDDAGLAAAMPLYVKEHGFGEYIFDWAWADASHRAGVPYYPKLVSAVPFTPATGRRVLRRADVSLAEVAPDLRRGLLEAASQARASSIHLLFLTREEADALGTDPRFMRRLSLQFHWHAAGDASFEDYLGRMRSPARKAVRRERRQAQELPFELELLRGDELGTADYAELFELYRAGCLLKGSFPYLTEAFFELMPERLAPRLLVARARMDGRTVAASLAFEKGAHLYGRYWGNHVDAPMLHFELCYYRLIEHAIDSGITRFEAGAQGEHKLKRGLMPASIHSLHLIRHPGLEAAIADYLPREAAGMRARMDELRASGPFRRD